MNHNAENSLQLFKVSQYTYTDMGRLSVTKFLNTTGQKSNI